MVRRISTVSTLMASTSHYTLGNTKILERTQMLSVFIAVAETQSFSAAAQRIRLSPAAVTRSIARLEEYLGVELLQRTTRRVRLTEAGRNYLHLVKSIVTQLNQIEDTGSEMLKGQLVIAAPDAFESAFVVPCISEFLVRHPGIDIVACFDEGGAGHRGECVDISIEVGGLHDPGLIATTVGIVRPVLCAAPSYLEQRGVPRFPGDLLRHSIIERGCATGLVEWQFESGQGTVVMRLRRSLAVTTEDLALSAACSGLGIARVYAFSAATLIRTGQLRPLLEPYQERALPVHVLSRDRGCKVPRIKHFEQALIDRLANDPRLQ